MYDKLFFMHKTIGIGLDPFNSWLALRSSKTLEVRVSAAQNNAMSIAKILQVSSKVEKVLYPGLTSHPDYKTIKKQQMGAGAMISFFIKGDLKGATRFLKALKLFTLATSLGDCKSLVENKVIMFQEAVLPERVRLIRLSVGIENEADLIADIKQALSKV